MRYLVDTDSSIDHLSNRLDLFSTLPGLTSRDLALSALSVVELYTGVYGSRDSQRAERQLRRYLRTLTVIPVNARVIEASARLRAELRSRNLAIGHRAFDLISAATARAYGLTLVTSNVRHYQDIPDLQILTPRTG